MEDARLPQALERLLYWRRSLTELGRLPTRIDRLERRVLNRLDRMEAGVEKRLERLAGRVAALEGLDARVAALEAMLLAAVTEEAENRRRLFALRASSSYEEPYTDAEPLVSIAIPTHDRPRLLVERSLPSVLGQSYERIEVIVVGDDAPPEVAEAVRSLGDPRIVYANLTQRIAAHPNPRKQHGVASTMARNEAFRLATGSWLVAFDDDDLMCPHHVRTLLSAARNRRLEVAYGRVRIRRSDGRSRLMGEFPPDRRRFSWQGALYHAGLRFFERELVAADLGLPGDWFLLRRMLRTGVRFGMVPDVVAEWYPSVDRAE